MQNKLSQQVTPSLSSGTEQEKRAELKAYFDNSWSSYESLFSLINNDQAYYLRPEPLRHPLIFYFGHTATFFINKLVLGKYIDKRIDAKIEAICAVGVDEMSWDDLDQTHYDWPSVEQVRDYRNKVHKLIHQLIDDMPIEMPIRQDSLAWLMLMGVEHERIHLETSSVIMRMLPLEQLTPSSQWASCKDVGEAPENELLSIAGSAVSLGKPDDADSYGWDNEYGHVKIDVPDFLASKFLVSNQEFLEFVEDEGYQSGQYWCQEGQSWLAFKKASMPRFWLKKGEQYFQRNLTEEIPLPLNWPVEVNYLEADAFCRWKSAKQNQIIRLPSEPEWLHLRSQLAGDITDWQEVPGNVNLEYFASSCPVNRFGERFFDVVGNVWQWTVSPIDAYDGFKVHPLYDDFSTPTFDGKHNLIKGGSWISTGNEAIKDSRYAFRRHFFQHAGFRYVSSSSEHVPLVESSFFETDIEVVRQLHSHYGNSQYVQQNYPEQLASFIANLIDKYQPNTDRLLDLGCSVGRTSFELAKQFTHVDGVDFSARYIQYGVQMQQQGKVRYAIEHEGDIVDFIEASATGLSLGEGDNILFSQGDASNLKPIFSQYDVILVQQLIERHYDAKRFFLQVSEKLNDGGLLIVATDYGFDESHVSRDKWFGGIKVNGENVSGFDGLTQLLTSSFALLETKELTLETKINHRNVQLSEKQVSVWQKRVAE